MVNDPTTRDLLEQAAAQLSQCQDHLDIVTLSIDGSLAAYAVGPEFAPHPYAEDVQVRRHPVPAGAKYQVLEFRALAGAQVTRMSREGASQVHVLQGSILIRRHDHAGAIEIHETGSTAKFGANESHGSLVLQDAHTILVFHSK